MPEKTIEKNPQWAARLKALRDRTGRSQQECADLMPCDVRTWERWESGKVPPEKNFPGIARVLGVSIEELQGQFVTHPTNIDRSLPPGKEHSSLTTATAEKERVTKYLLDMQEAIQDSLASLSPDAATDPFWQNLREIDVVIRRAQHALEELDARGMDMTTEEHEQLLADFKALYPPIDALVSLAKTARGAQADFYRAVIARSRKGKREAQRDSNPPSISQRAAVEGGVTDS